MKNYLIGTGILILSSVVFFSLTHNPKVFLAVAVAVVAVGGVFGFEKLDGRELRFTHYLSALMFFAVIGFMFASYPYAKAPSAAAKVPVAEKGVTVANKEQVEGLRGYTHFVRRSVHLTNDDNLTASKNYLVDLGLNEVDLKLFYRTNRDFYGIEGIDQETEVDWLTPSPNFDFTYLSSGAVVTSNGYVFSNKTEFLKSLRLNYLSYCLQARMAGQLEQPAIVSAAKLLFTAAELKAIADKGSVEGLSTEASEDNMKAVFAAKRDYLIQFKGNDKSPKPGFVKDFDDANKEANEQRKQKERESRS